MYACLRFATGKLHPLSIQGSVVRENIFSPSISAKLGVEAGISKCNQAKRKKIITSILFQGHFPSKQRLAKGGEKKTVAISISTCFKNSILMFYLSYLLSSIFIDIYIYCFLFCFLFHDSYPGEGVWF